MSEENKIRDAADAVAGVLKAVPLYQDAIQPAAKEIGIGLQTIAKTIHIALAPIGALVWGYEKLNEFLSTKLAEKLKNVPPEKIVTPEPNVAGPILEALRYTGHDEPLREMYANLLAASLDQRTEIEAHPAFVEIIRQLTPDEAKLLQIFTPNRAFPVISLRWQFKKGNAGGRTGGKNVLKNFSLLGYEANCQFPDRTPTYLNNFCRLGLINLPVGNSYTTAGTYDALINHPTIIELTEQILKNNEIEPKIEKGIIEITDLGEIFYSICVQPHENLHFEI